MEVAGKNGRFADGSAASSSVRRSSTRTPVITNPRLPGLHRFSAKYARLVRGSRNGVLLASAINVFLICSRLYSNPPARKSLLDRVTSLRVFRTARRLFENESPKGETKR